jgi:hypothetical protein
VAACASPATLKALKSVLLAKDNLPESDDATQSYRDQITSAATLELAKPAVAQSDKHTSILSCSADVKFTWPKNLATRLASVSSDVSWGSYTSGIIFSIQPKAGDSYVLVQSGADELTGAVQSMVNALNQSDADDLKVAKADELKTMENILRHQGAPATSDVETAVGRQP